MYFGFFVFDFISVKHFGQPWLYIRCSINKSDLDLDLDMSTDGPWHA